MSIPLPSEKLSPKSKNQWWFIYTGMLKWVMNVKCRWQKSPISSFIKNLSLGNSLAVQWLGLRAFTVGAWVRSVISELRSCKPQGWTKTKKNQKESEFIWSFHSNSELRKSERRYSTWLPQEKTIFLKKCVSRSFPGGSVGSTPPASAGDMGSLPDPERSLMPRSNQACVPQPLSLYA